MRTKLFMAALAFIAVPLASEAQQKYLGNCAVHKGWGAHHQRPDCKIETSLFGRQRCLPAVRPISQPQPQVITVPQSAPSSPPIVNVAAPNVDLSQLETIGLFNAFELRTQTNELAGIKGQLDRLADELVRRGALDSANRDAFLQGAMLEMLRGRGGGLDPRLYNPQPALDPRNYNPQPALDPRNYNPQPALDPRNYNPRESLDPRNYRPNGSLDRSGSGRSEDSRSEESGRSDERSGSGGGLTPPTGGGGGLTPPSGGGGTSGLRAPTETNISRRREWEEIFFPNDPIRKMMAERGMVAAHIGAGGEVKQYVPWEPVKRSRLSRDNTIASQDRKFQQKISDDFGTPWPNRRQ